METAVRYLLLSLALALPAAAQADEWTGPDKLKHFGAGVVMGVGGTLLWDKEHAVLYGLTVAVAKEYYDARHTDRHTPSYKDAFWTGAGVLLSANGTEVVLRKGFVGLQIKFD
jgi:uncharacterized protein YfiM (DUF2279 family)